MLNMIIFRLLLLLASYNAFVAADNFESATISVTTICQTVAYTIIPSDSTSTTKPTLITDPTSTTQPTTMPSTYYTNTTTITNPSSSSTTSPTQTVSTSIYCDIPAPTSTSLVKFAGINIAGIDFGVDEFGNYNPALAIPDPPLTAYGSADGLGQMQHFVNDDGFNIFRLPVAWQFLTGGTPGGSLDPTNFAEYNTLVKSCLSTGAYCIIDLHNYAYFYGGIVGQGGPSDSDYITFWKQMASYWAGTPEVMFGLMHAPHDIPNLAVWANTLQQAVQVIRDVGAMSQFIILPGTDYAHADTFISSGSAAALSVITDYNGSTDLLLFDVQKFLDKPINGTLPDCVEDGISSALYPLAQWLRCNKRHAIITETGGGNTDTCLKYLCAETAFIKTNYDVYLGYLGWAAGNYDSTYALNESPVYSGGIWVDQLIIQCLLN